MPSPWQQHFHFVLKIFPSLHHLFQIVVQRSPFCFNKCIHMWFAMIFLYPDTSSCISNASTWFYNNHIWCWHDNFSPECLVIGRICQNIASAVAQRPAEARFPAILSSDENDDRHLFSCTYSIYIIYFINSAHYSHSSKVQINMIWFFSMLNMSC